jgi:hypothetical protein
MTTVIAILVSIAVMALLQTLLGNKIGTEATVKQIAANARPVAWNFVALEYCYGMLNRTYVVFVTNVVICAAKVRCILPAPLTAGRRWHDPYFDARPAQMKRYVDVDLESQDFLARGWANFQIPKQDLESVTFSADAKWGMGTVPYSGRIFLRTKNGRKRELVLLGTQNGREICAKLAVDVAPTLAA